MATRPIAPAVRRRPRRPRRLLTPPLWVAGAAFALLALPTPSPGGEPQQHRHQGPPEHRGMGAHRGGGEDHAQDMELFHYLMDHGKDIRRTITTLPNGVDTLTESDDPEVAARIQMHVLSMAARVKEQRPIHMRDPLFAEIFANADKIVMRHENTAKGVRVVETSDDPYVARLIQSHAEVVSLFIKNGRSEARKNHEVPSR